MTSSQDNEARKNRSRAILTAAGLAVITAALYLQLYRHEFIYFDDQVYITENPHVNTGFSWANIRWAFHDMHTDYWHPLTWLSYMLDMELFGMWAGGHHMVNLALHILSALLAFGWLRQTTGRHWASAFVAALFALHPLRVESVAWAAERKDVLSASFWFAAIWAYSCYAAQPSLRRYAAVAVLFALGLLSKPILVTLPVVLLLLDYWPLHRLNVSGLRLCATGRSGLRLLILEKIPLLIMSAGVATLVAAGQQKTAMIDLEIMPPASRVANAAASYCWYIGKMFWPTGLNIFHRFSHMPRLGEAVVPLVLLAIVTAVCVFLVRRFRYLIVGWLWYIVTLVPVIGLVQVGLQARADRYSYLPLTGLFIIVAFAAADLAAHQPRMRPVLTIAAAAILAASAVVSWRIVSYWENDFTVFGRALSVDPDNAFIRNVLATALLHRGDCDGAMMELHKSAAIRRNPDTYYLLGIAAQRKGLTDEALNYYIRATELDPDALEAHAEAGKLLYELGRHAEAEGHLRKAVQIRPAPAQVHRLLGAILAEKGQYAAAAEQYRASLSSEPDFAAWNNLGDAQLQMQQFAEAIKSLTNAMAMNPGNAVVHFNMGTALAGLGRNDEALEELRKALVLDPNYAKAAAFYRRLAGEEP